MSLTQKSGKKRCFAKVSTIKVWQTPYCQTFFFLYASYIAPRFLPEFIHGQKPGVSFSVVCAYPVGSLFKLSDMKKYLTSYNVGVYISAGYETCHLYPHSQLSSVKPLGNIPSVHFLKGFFFSKAVPICLLKKILTYYFVV